MRSFLLYAVVRLGLWILLWWLLTLLGLGIAVAGVAAALVAMLISILALEPLRHRAAMRWKDAHEARVARRGPVHDGDAEFEDAVLDEAEGSGDGEDSPSRRPADQDGAEEPDQDPDAEDHGGASGAGTGPGDVRGSDR